MKEREREREENKKVILLNRATFANPKSASFTDPLASTNILEHLMSLENWIEKRQVLAQSKSMYHFFLLSNPCTIQTEENKFSCDLPCSNSNININDDNMVAFSKNYKSL